MEIGPRFIVPSDGLENLRPLVYKASGITTAPRRLLKLWRRETSCSGDCNFEKTAKCVNCSGVHPTFSHDCPTWHNEKELLKIKYTRNLPFFEARKNCRTAIVHDKQELCQHHKMCWHTSQTR